MDKKELIAAISERTGKKKSDCREILNVMLEVIGEKISENEKVQLVGFGSFKLQERKARTGRNLYTGESMQIQARKKPIFKAGRNLTDLVNKA